MKLVFSVFVFILATLSSLPAQSVLSSSPLKVEKQFYFISVNINGKGPYNFMLDTGAGITVVSPSLAIQLGLTASGTAKIGTAGNKVVSTTYEQVVLEVGDFSLGTCTLEALPIQHLEDYLGIPLHGIIGSDLLHRHLVELNLDSRQILFHSSIDFVEGTSWLEMPMTHLPYGHFGVPVAIQVNKEDPLRKFLLKVDSGYNNYVTFTGQTVQNYGMLTQKNYKKAQGVSVDTTITTNLSGRVRRIELAEETWKRKKVIFPVDPISLAATEKSVDEGIIGNGLLMDFNLLFDYAGKKMYFQACK